VLHGSDVPDDAGVAIEFKIPLTSRRIDFLISGYDPDKHDTMTEAERIEMYQAWAEYRENLRTGTKPGE
jgi:hypothetical protein